MAETRPEHADHADVRILPPLLFLASILLGVAAHFLLPLRFAAGSGLRIAAGVAVVLLGVAAIGWPIVWMRRTKQDPDPRKPTPELIVSGPFRWSRNPIYVGMAAVEAGLAVALGNAWLLLLLPPTLWILQREVIEKEEEYLERRFGDAYAAYRRSVRRWL
jgi:protein-S-isoprenylcysteine O-methyltransferase Ste14